jgi:hypothetical protein
MSGTIYLSDILKDDIPTLDGWVEEEEFDYTRRESEVVDYLNTVIDYDVLDEKLDDYDADTEIAGWGDIFSNCEIEKDSDESTAATTHITSYIEFYSDR